MFFEELSHFIDAKAPPKSEELSQLENELNDWAQSSCFPSIFFQPVVRGIPRLFLATDPSQSKIKRPFSNRAALIYQWLDRPLLNLYSSQHLQGPFQVTLLTWVISDGWGDLLAQIEAAKILAKGTSARLTLLTLIHQDKNAPVIEHDFEQHWIRYAGELNGPITYEPLSQLVLQKLSSSDLIVEMPTAFPHIHELVGKACHVRLGEHSMSDTIHYHPGTRAKSMGLHFLEKGIFIKTLPQLDAKQAIRLSDERLEHLLFRTFEDRENYQAKRSFQLAYTKTFRGLFLYLTALLSSLEEDTRDVDLCFFQIDLLLCVLIEKFQKGTRFPLFETWNVKECIIHTGQVQSVIPVGKTGKTVRLIHCNSLCHADILKLTALTDCLIGSTGDQSVLEAISAEKPFFYDPPPFKRPFLKDLLWIAKKKLPEFPELSQFFQLCLKNPSLTLEENQEGWVNEEYLQILGDRLSLEEETDLAIGLALGKLLKDPLLPSAFQALSRYLAQAYPIDPILCGLVNRAQLFQKNPHLAKLEESEIERLIQGSQTLDATLKKIAELVKE